MASFEYMLTVCNPSKTIYYARETPSIGSNPDEALDKLLKNVLGQKDSKDPLPVQAECIDSNGNVTPI